MALRTRTRTALLAAAGSVVVALAATGCGEASAEDAPVERKAFAFSGKTLTVDTDNADVTLVPADVKDVEVTRQVNGWVFMGNGPDATWAMKGDRLTLRVKCSGIASDCEARHEVKVPRGVTVVVEGDNGDVTASGFDTGLTVRSDNGDVTVRDVRGALDLGSDNGDITVTGARGKVAGVTSDNGDVQLGFTVVPDRVKAESDNGDIEVRLPKGVYKVTAESDLGDVDVSVDRSDSSAHAVTARSDNGDITVRRAG
ncbi:DUF4097 family beta strand repeat-containing protein [Streptomyces sannanensis]|uniref:DUF4097 family beta strand repeat-containing protein n=1 Tax=Streptomyces sannanensis TaxID=285536 RepID=A0ABP6S9Y6_9ACTN